MGLRNLRLRGNASPRRSGLTLWMEPLERRELLSANPILTEFMASNQGWLRDGDGETPDWIEVYNAGDADVDLAGYRLTDDPRDLSRWIFPGRSLAAGEYLVVFASGQDGVGYVDALGNLHTNFRLSRTGDYLALVSPSGRIISEFGPGGTDFPEQLPNVSYGVAQPLDTSPSNAESKVGYMQEPTPGAQNVSSQAVLTGFVTDTRFSVDRGFYDTPQIVEITTDTPQAEIFYTTDGSVPSPTNPAATLYSGPLTVSTTTTLRAAAFRADFMPSNVDTHTYIFVDDVLRQTNSPTGYPDSWKTSTGPLPADYEMDAEITQHPAYRDIVDDALLSIPTISIVTDVGSLFDFETGIYMNPEQKGVAWERPASVEFIFPDGADGIQADAGLRIQGGNSRRPHLSPKHSFRLLFKGVYGDPSLRFPLFGDQAVSEFETITLRAGFNQSWVHDNGNGDNRIRAQYIRDQWAKDTQLAMGHAAAHNRYAHLYVNGLYWGLYNPTERPDAAFGAAYFGGDKEDYDALNAGQVIDGNADAWNELFRLANGGLAGDVEYRAISETLDIDAFVDYMILNHYGGNVAWDNENWYAMRRREPGGKWLFFSWDAEHIFLTEKQSRLHLDGDRRPSRLFNKLIENDEFRVTLADHIQRHFFGDGVLTPQSVVDRWEARSQQVYLPLVAESARWGDYRRDVHRGGAPYQLYERDVQWAAERNRLLTEYFPTRTATVLQHYRDAGLFPMTDAPTLSRNGGSILTGFSLEIANPNDAGTVYYTLDGSDPRAVGGGVSRLATAYDGTPVTLRQDAHVKARVRNGDEWSALTEATFFVNDLRVTEINYHPHPANPVRGLGEPAVGHDAFEFVELTNVGPNSADLTNVRLSGSVEFTFPAGSRIAPGQRIVVASDQVAFQSRYGIGPNVAGQFDGGQLPDEGGLVELRDASDRVIQAFNYSAEAPWPSRANGRGSSIELVDPRGPFDNPANWRSSSGFGGSPGEVDVDPNRNVIINELLTNSLPPRTDAIELRNVGGKSVDIGFWYLSDSGDDYFKYEIPSPTSVASRGFHVISPPELIFDFDGARGGEMWLIEADQRGAPRRFADHVVFGATRQDVSIGRWPDANGPLLPLTEPTFGSANASPRVGEVVISEVQYYPDDRDGPGKFSPEDFEFIELYNATDGELDVSQWRITGGVDFTFPLGTTIGAEQTLLVVPFDPDTPPKPAVFRLLYGLPQDTAFVGPYFPSLSDQGARLRLERPDGPRDEPSGFTPYVYVDEVNYGSRTPWPTAAAGTGMSLQRTVPQAYGNFPISWRTPAASPGIVDFFARLAGDANEDGRVDPLDVELVLQANKYMTDAPATWQEGDWTGDGVFNQLDVIAALHSS